jgi:hypothetical protein
MTCLSCRFSVRDQCKNLYCGLLLRPAIKRCGSFDYEPGTDEMECAHG